MTVKCCAFDFVIEFEKQIDFEFEQIYVVGDHEKYQGPYTATPKVESQNFETKNKVMIDDFVVEEIPYDETSNEYGTTCVIAS